MRDPKLYCDWCMNYHTPDQPDTHRPIQEHWSTWVLGLVLTGFLLALFLLPALP